MRSWVLILCIGAGVLMADWPQGTAVDAAASCGHAPAGRSGSSAGGCPWQGPLIVNSDDDYWIRASDGHTVLAAHIQAQCRIYAQFSVPGFPGTPKTKGSKPTVSAAPQSVGLISYQMEDTVTQVTFYLTKGAPSNDLLKPPIFAFKVAPYLFQPVREAGSLTTKLPASGGTDVTLPAKYHFRALFYHPNNMPIDGAPGATLYCGSASGQVRKIHLANTYGSSGNPYTATQMHDSSTVQYPVPTTYKYGPKTTFPEKDLLVESLKILGLVHPKYRGERFDPQTVFVFDGKTMRPASTLGLTRYALGQGNNNETPMTRPTPCDK